MKNKNLWMIPISDSMKEKLKFDNMLEVVYHGIDTTQIKNFSPEDYFCWVGRVAPSKGLHIAMDVAEKLNLKLKIAGPMTDVILDFGDVSKYIEDIRNRIKKSKNFEYLGILGPKETMELIGKSKGLIFPSDGNESFSMVTAEAIISGTPAIVSNLGPLPELVKDRVNGFVCSDTKEIIEAVKNIDTIDRLKCRENAISRFSLDIMVKNYEEQFERATKLIKG
jgi:glycosyltransferase involved in cell wall biosynthesis